jgi:hypothetical protein
VAAAIVASVIYADPQSAIRGAVLLAIGIPVYFFFARQRQARRAKSGMHT